MHSEDKGISYRNNHKKPISQRTIGKNDRKVFLEWWSCHTRGEGATCLDNRIDLERWKLFDVKSGVPSKAITTYNSSLLEIPILSKDY